MEGRSGGKVTEKEGREGVAVAACQCHVDTRGTCDVIEETHLEQHRYARKKHTWATEMCGERERKSASVRERKKECVCE